MSRLKAAREARSWSQASAIAALRAYARALGHELPSGASLKTQLSRWENGHRVPDDFYRRLLVGVYGRPAAELGLGGIEANPRTLTLGRDLQDAADIACQLWDDDMNRRKLIKTAAVSAAAYITPLRALVLPLADPPDRAEGSFHVDLHQVDDMQQIANTFGEIDNRRGGGQVRTAAVRYLHGEVAPLLKQGRFSSATGHELFQSAARLTHLVGWMSHDVGAHDLGQRYLVQALSLARTGNDEALMAEILAAMSHQASYLGHGHEAVDLARASRTLADRRGVTALVAEAYVMEAHGHAQMNEGQECAAALHAAELALDRGSRNGEPDWIGYFDEAYLAAKFGHCFRALGDNDNAVTFAERSLNMDSNRYARGHAFNLTLLAHSHAQRGDVEQACSIGLQALVATSDLCSNRAVSYLMQLRNSLSPAALDQPAAVHLAETISELATAA